MRSPVSRRVALGYAFFASLLALTGVMQMPIASRYRIAAVPGLGWLGDFWLTHRLHYVGAVGLLFLTAYVATRWLLEWRRDYALSVLGWTRAAIVFLLLATGAVRVLKNLPSVSFPPVPTMLVDWAHLALALLLGLVALLRLACRAKYWRNGRAEQPETPAPRQDERA
jgi:hypothetical protein